jgi:TusA-related sulfurtransferase
MRKIKSILTVLCIVLGLVCVVGCKDSQKEKKIKDDIEALNKKLPIDIGSGFITKIDYSEGVATYNILLNEESFFSVDKLKGHEDLLKENLLIFFASSKDKGTTNDMLADGINYKYVYTGAKSGDKLEILVTYEDMKRSMNELASKEVLNERLLNNMIATENLQYPSDVAMGMRAMRCYREGDFVVFEVECDESLMDMEALEMNLAQMKEGSFKALIENPSAVVQLQSYIDNNVGLTYRYVGRDSGYIVDIEFTCDEIKSALSGKKQENPIAPLTEE